MSLLAWLHRCGSEVSLDCTGIVYRRRETTENELASVRQPEMVLPGGSSNRHLRADWLLDGTLDDPA